MTAQARSNSQRPGAFSKDWSPGDPPIVPSKKYQPKEVTARKIKTNGGSKEKRRVQMFIDAWEHYGGESRPNWTITINLPSPIPFPETLPTRTVHAYVLRSLLNPVGSDMKSRSLPWRWVSVIEVKGGNYHVHGLAYFPCRKTLLQVLYRVWKKVADPGLRTRYYFETDVFRRSSGTPLYATPVDPDMQYSGTGRRGIEGYSDYMVKNLDDMTKRRRFCQEIGSPTIISRDVNKLVAKKTFGLRSVTYTPACHRDYF